MSRPIQLPPICQNAVMEPVTNEAIYPAALISRLALSRALLLVAWCVASWSPLRWMASALMHAEHVVQRGILLGLAALGCVCFFATIQSRHIHPKAVPIALQGIAIAAITRIATDIQFVHAGGALVLLYTLSAAVMDVQHWRQRRVLLMIVLICLPIQPHVDAYLGLPLRLWTAQVVTPLLHALGIGSVTVESVIVTENNVADVASACSGVRTLWYAMALWLCARLAWPNVSPRRWWLAGLLSVGVAVAFNALRVAMLVLALHHQAPMLLADMAHASVGLLALAAVGVLNLRLCRNRADVLPRAAALSASPTLSWPSLALLIGLLLGLALLPSPSRSTVDPVRLHYLNWPAEFHTEPFPLSDVERDLVLGHHATVAEKHRFVRNGVSGSLLVVESANWRAQHAPELCLLAQGAHIEKVARLSTPDGVFRVVTLQAGKQTAITWFQSGISIVPDLGARLWAQFFHRQEHWALITLVVDGALSSVDALDLQRAVQSVVSTSEIDRVTNSSQELP